MSCVKMYFFMTHLEVSAYLKYYTPYSLLKIVKMW